MIVLVPSGPAFIFNPWLLFLFCLNSLLAIFIVCGPLCCLAGHLEGCMARSKGARTNGKIRRRERAQAAANARESTNTGTRAGFTSPPPTPPKDINKSPSNKKKRRSRRPRWYTPVDALSLNRLARNAAVRRLERKAAAQGVTSFSSTSSSSTSSSSSSSSASSASLGHEY